MNTLRTARRITRAAADRAGTRAAAALVAVLPTVVVILDAAETIGGAALAAAARVAERAAAAWYQVTGTGYGAALDAGTPTGAAVSIPADARRFAADYVWTKTPAPARRFRFGVAILAAVCVLLGAAATTAIVASGEPAIGSWIPATLGVAAGAAVVRSVGLTA